MQSERKKLSKKLKEVKTYLRDVDWTSIQENILNMKNAYDTSMDKFNLNAATMESNFIANIDAAKGKSIKSFKTECKLETITLKNDLMTDLRNDLKQELKDQQDIFVIQLETEHQKHLKDIQLIMNKNQQTIAAMTTSNTNTIPSGYPPTNILLDH